MPTPEQEREDINREESPEDERFALERLIKRIAEMKTKITDLIGGIRERREQAKKLKLDAAKAQRLEAIYDMAAAIVRQAETGPAIEERVIDEFDVDRHIGSKEYAAAELKQLERIERMLSSEKHTENWGTIKLEQADKDTVLRDCIGLAREIDATISEIQDILTPLGFEYDGREGFVKYSTTDSRGIDAKVSVPANGLHSLRQMSSTEFWRCFEGEYMAMDIIYKDKQYLQKMRTGLVMAKEVLGRLKKQQNIPESGRQ